MNPRAAADENPECCRGTDLGPGGDGNPEIPQHQDFNNVNVATDVDDVTNLRALSPALSNRRDSQCSQDIVQQSVSVEDQLQGALLSRAQSMTTLNDLTGEGNSSPRGPDWCHTFPPPSLANTTD
ncbi:centrosomal protein of 131 kDa-like [Oncorhynchus tshawytscha]|uniref:centrosomal protein of 131 kDa-like n=1 Tax=Oncorhynchus tshawytscha TaxID=74940 RepID=UPI001C3DA85E|nr:centrosomal protein of 131 kDa-like [Oncorhynchus tshawytscha]